MKRWMLFPLAVLILWPVSLAAQEAAQEGEYSPTWWVVFTEQVAPSNVAAFEKASAAMHEVIEANAPEDMVFYTLSGPETGFVYAIPMESMGDFMKLNEQWMGMINRIGMETWDAMTAKSDALVDYTTTNFYVERQDLSYWPEAMAASADDMMMRHYDWLYPKPGMQDEFVEVLKEWVALYQEHDLDTGWTTFQAVSGDELPLFVLSTPAENLAEFAAMGDAIDELLGEAGEELMQKSMAMLRKYEHNNAWLRPELSLMPDEM